MEEHEDIFKNLKAKPHGSLPESYLSDLTQTILTSSSIKNKRILVYQRPIFWISACAASIVLFFGLHFFKENSDIEYSTNEVTHHELLAYVSENIDEFDQELFIPFISSDDSKNKTLLKEENATKTTVESVNHSLNSLEREEIIEYLELQEIDLDELEKFTNL